MRLTSFEVQGFKNLVAPVKLDELGPINVLHGANNVGKSNLLRAIEVFFRLLGTPTRWQAARGYFDSDPERFPSLGSPVADLFNYAAPAPIRMSASVNVDVGALPLDGLEKVITGSRVVAALSLVSLADRRELALTIDPFRVGDRAVGSTPETALARIAKLLQARALGPRGVAHVDVHRDIDQAVDALYDASSSTDRKQALQWERFVEVMASFRDILGDGRFLAVLPRGEQHARLLYETPTMRIPLHALGSGVQQIVALFGHLLTCGAAIVTVEEPELNLRWSLQERVRDALRNLVVLREMAAGP
jgi:hypothetical protein